ncbi:ChbG/HpnK family deacetylase [Ruania alkalisoli]|uniref:ChbG/HpnK family deacetylase n=1 Tax=Ruania alkalisoli TaxID=2779775 RepID=A0A7M1STS6_9MICO|nr:ChbG/HpnK family deacetylase [Ruania alkalisoli]QOR70925.1 ChbG/HpnK family deacetylase [Ruania alkalisoli]
MRRLVLTADDLGRDAATTAEIVALAREGLITATTVIPVAPASAEATEQITTAQVATRVHLTLTSEASETSTTSELGVAAWRPLADVPSLVEADGSLTTDPYRLGARGRTEHVLTELEAQLAWTRAQGLHVTAADSHAGTLYGLHGQSWLEPALRWCARHGLGFRLPRDLAPYLGGPAPEPLRSAHAAAVALADELGVPIPQTMITNDRTAAEWGDYEAFRRGMLARVATLGEGTSELFLHPSSAPEIRAWEARLLRDPALRETFRSEGITLVAGW